MMHWGCGPQANNQQILRLQAFQIWVAREPLFRFEHILSLLNPKICKLKFRFRIKMRTAGIPEMSRFQDLA